jgi:hypothetical protein
MPVPRNHSLQLSHEDATTSIAEHASTLPKSFAQGEQSLWRAVITQALMDAASQSQKLEAQKHKRDALLWLSEQGEDFTQICDLAGMDAAYVFDKAAMAIAERYSWKQSHGMGWRTIKLRKEDVFTTHDYAEAL